MFTPEAEFRVLSWDRWEGEQVIGELLVKQGRKQGFQQRVPLEGKVDGYLRESGPREMEYSAIGGDLR